MVTSDSAPLVVALTGASGMPYARRLLDVLVHAGRHVYLVLSPAAAQVLAGELGIAVDLDRFQVEQLVPAGAGRVHYCHYSDFNTGIASGSFATAGMVICPCTMDTLGSLASGACTNLIHRAADVHLKERRRLVLVPRETPLTAIHLENMARLARAGAVILPPMPGFYHRPTTIDDLVDFVVARICDHLDVAHDLVRPWGAD